MSSTARLTLGHIPYLNCVPFFHYLQDAGFRGELVSGVPSALNRMLQTGKLDVSPSSSFEYARNWRDYYLLPGHSISSFGPVQSVLLFSPMPPEHLSSEEIYITGDSATSINLLRVLLREFYGQEDVTDTVPNQPVEDLIAQKKPALLIGDRALYLADQCPAGVHIYDLGEIWHQQTGLPFVFALWMVRKTALKNYPGELQELGRQLQLSRKRFLENSDALAARYAEQGSMTAQQIANYWNSIDFGLQEVHIEGMKLFFALCKKHQLLAEEPQIEFLPEK